MEARPAKKLPKRFPSLQQEEEPLQLVASLGLILPGKSNLCHSHNPLGLSPFQALVGLGFKVAL